MTQETNQWRKKEVLTIEESNELKKLASKMSKKSLAQLAGTKYGPTLCKWLREERIMATPFRAVLEYLRLKEKIDELNKQ